MTTPAAAAPPLLLVTIDRLPAWLLPPWGCGWVSMPALTSLAARGLVFDRLATPTADPAQVLAAFGGGSHGDAACPWPLLTAAAAAGLAPAVITDDASFAASLVAAAIPSLDVVEVPIEVTAATAADEASTNLGRLFTTAAERLASGSHRLLWCHASSLGTTWDAPDDYRAAYIDPEDPPPPDGATVPDMIVDEATDPDLIVGLRHVLAGQLTLFDQCLGWLVDELPAQDAGWMILVAGVRGMGLGLHGRLGCGPLPPFSELIHLPAVLVDHHERMAAQRFGGLVIPADLGTTLLATIGQPAADSPDPRRGRSLVPLLDDWLPPGRDRVIATTPDGLAVITPAWQLVTAAAAGSADSETAPSPRLFAKPDDYFELSDVADRCPAVTEELVGLAARASTAPEEAWSLPLSAAAVRGV